MRKRVESLADHRRFILSSHANLIAFSAVQRRKWQMNFLKSLGIVEYSRPLRIIE
jgi:hypothetical protein